MEQESAYIFERGAKSTIVFDVDPNEVQGETKGDRRLTYNASYHTEAGKKEDSKLQPNQQVVVQNEEGKHVLSLTDEQRREILKSFGKRRKR